MNKVLVEKLDEQFIKRFGEIDNIEKNSLEILYKIVSKRKTYDSKEKEIWYDLRRRYGLEKVKGLFYSLYFKKILSSDGAVLVDRLEDEFIKRFDEQVKLRKDIDADIDIGIKLSKDFVLGKNAIFHDLTVFYELKNISGVFEYDAFKKQIVLIEDLDNPKG